MVVVVCVCVLLVNDATQMQAHMKFLHQSCWRIRWNPWLLRTEISAHMPTKPTLRIFAEVCFHFEKFSYVKVNSSTLFQFTVYICSILPRVQEMYFTLFLLICIWPSALCRETSRQSLVIVRRYSIQFTKKIGQFGLFIWPIYFFHNVNPQPHCEIDFLRCVQTKSLLNSI